MLLFTAYATGGGAIIALALLPGVALLALVLATIVCSATRRQPGEALLVG
jgi:hypothetical protein